MRSFEKIWKNLRHFEICWDILIFCCWQFEKAWESFEKDRAGFRKFWKVCESLRKFDKVVEGHMGQINQRSQISHTSQMGQLGGQMGQMGNKDPLSQGIV